MSIKKINDIHSTNRIRLLEKKLNGELPVTREELLYLVNSWGRKTSFYTKDSQNKDMYIEECEPKECYDLSKLDVSQITDMGDIFPYSSFNKDISNWDVSNVTNMAYMFANTLEFNQPLKDWNVSNVTNMELMFCFSENFNQNISSWNLDKVEYCNYIFDNAKAFLDKYNNGFLISKNTNEIKEWINNNRERMNEIDIKDKHGDQIDDFFSNILLTECNKLCL